ncbi:MAG TPA: hypothetical protein VGN57_13510 [Pirellulaceae bacterium]|jgi:hypothetical protein|nr:hypothetical protein [Pirellulaceae bacterium]
MTVEFSFTLVAAGLSDARQVPESIVETGCDDCTVSSCEGRVRLEFDREATSLVEAVGSAIIDLKKAGVSAWLESVETPAGVVDAA